LRKKCGRNGLAYLAAALATKKKRFAILAPGNVRQAHSIYLLATSKKKREKVKRKNVGEK